MTGMDIFMIVLLGFLIFCAIAASLSKSLLNTILIFMSYSLIMSVIWIILESPDLAITEAAVGAGVTTVLFLITLKKIHAIIKEDAEGTVTYEESAQAEIDEVENVTDAENTDVTSQKNEGKEAQHE